MRLFPVPLYLVLLFSFVLLAGYAADVPPQGFDVVLLDAVRNLQSPALNSLIQGVEFLGETWPAIILPIPFVAWLWVKGCRREAVWFIAALLLVSVASASIKGIVDRTRPDGGNFSFASGHTSYFTVFSGYLLVTLRCAVENHKWLTAWRVGLSLLIVLTAFSRLYLGEHWPTDVLGGFLLGAIVLMPVLWRVDSKPLIAT